MTDLIRATIIVEEGQYTQILDVYEELCKVKSLQIIRIKEKLEKLQNITRKIEQMQEISYDDEKNTDNAPDNILSVLAEKKVLG